MSLLFRSVVTVAMLALGVAPYADGVAHDPALEQIPAEEAGMIKTLSVRQSHR